MCLKRNTNTTVLDSFISKEAEQKLKQSMSNVYYIYSLFYYKSFERLQQDSIFSMDKQSYFCNYWHTFSESWITETS